MFSRNYLIIYDIKANKTRRKVVKILEEFGVRVQYSAFECYLSVFSKKKIKKSLENTISINDSIRIYKLPSVTEVINSENEVNNRNDTVIV